MDVYCARCGEPWDTWELRHEARAALVSDGFRFGVSTLVVLECPACKSKEARDDYQEAAAMMGNAAALLGDDMDGLEVILSDMRQ
jgi:hypothetical protein